jgi:hypothetical protein
MLRSTGDIAPVADLGDGVEIMGSSDRLEIDLGGLEQFAIALDRIRTEMRDAPRWMNEFQGELGGREVDDALSDFESHWSDGRSRVDKNCERLVTATRQAVEHLRKADEDLARELRDSVTG